MSAEGMLVVNIGYQNCRKCTQREHLARVVPSATRLVDPTASVLDRRTAPVVLNICPENSVIEVRPRSLLRVGSDQQPLLKHAVRQTRSNAEAEMHSSTRPRTRLRNLSMLGRRDWKITMDFSCCLFVVSLISPRHFAFSAIKLIKVRTISSFPENTSGGKQGLKDPAKMRTQSLIAMVIASMLVLVTAMPPNQIFVSLCLMRCRHDWAPLFVFSHLRRIVKLEDSNAMSLHAMLVLSATLNAYEKVAGSARLERILVPMQQVPLPGCRLRPPVLLTPSLIEPDPLSGRIGCRNPRV